MKAAHLFCFFFLTLASIARCAPVDKINPSDLEHLSDTMQEVNPDVLDKKKKKKDQLQAQIGLSLGAVGVATTIGWIYIAYKSMMDNFHRNESIRKHKEQCSHIITKRANVDNDRAKDVALYLGILNAVGSLPSLVMTFINAQFLRGNPRVDPPEHAENSHCTSNPPSQSENNNSQTNNSDLQSGNDHEKSASDSSAPTHIPPIASSFSVSD